MQNHMKSQHSDLMEEMNRDQAYSDEVADKLHEALKDFKANGSWLSGQPGAMKAKSKSE